jgi:uncharacterized cupin superfamily protein
MPKLDLDAIPQNNTTLYPPPFNADVQERWKRRLGPVAGLSHIGATHAVLKPGAWSSQRHWHSGEDELLVMLSGEAVLVEDNGRTLLRPGDICAWPKGVENGHHVINESSADCSFLAISGGPDTGGSYPDIDMMWTGDGSYRHKDGTRY